MHGAAGLARVPFWFLRHGETDWNRANRTQGSTEVALNATGITQAEAAAALMRDRGVRFVACSPLGRARQTADIVAQVLGVAVHIHDDLREANFGAHEGEVMGEWFAAWVEGRVVPERGESFADVGRRAVAGLNGVLAAPGPALVVAHGGMFRTVRAAMGFTATVRTPNGIPLWCAPAGDGWTITEASALS